MDAMLDRLGRNRFVVIGRAGLDLYPEPDGTKIEDASGFRADLGGSAGNIAVALARLGADAALLSPLADDPVGRFTRNTLARYNVDASLCRAVGGEARNTLALAETRAADCEVVIYRNGAADFELSESDISGLDYAGVGAVIATGTSLAREPSRSTIMTAYGRAREAGVVTVLDLDYRPYSWGSDDEARTIYEAAINHCDIVIGNDDEFGLIAGSKADALACARKLAGAGTSITILKLGAGGSVTLAGGRSIETGIFPVKVLKPFGAGDAFMGALMAGLASGLDVAEAVRQGSAAAAIVVSRPGCASAMPVREDLNTFMAGKTVTQKTNEDTHAHSTV